MEYIWYNIREKYDIIYRVLEMPINYLYNIVCAYRMHMNFKDF